MADEFSWSISEWDRLLEEIITQFIDGEDPILICVSPNRATLQAVRITGGKPSFRRNNWKY